MKDDKTRQRSNCNTATAPSHSQLKKAKNVQSNQRKAILSHFNKHGRITTLEAYQMAILCPAARMFELRRLGYPIETERDWNYNGMATYIMKKNHVMNKCGVSK